MKIILVFLMLGFISCEESSDDNEPKNELTESSITNDPNLKCAFYVESKMTLSDYDITENFKVYYQRYTQTVTKSTCQEILAEGSTQHEMYYLQRVGNTFYMESEKGDGVDTAIISGNTFSFPSQTEDLGNDCVLKAVYSGSINYTSSLIISKSVMGLIGRCGSKSVEEFVNIKKLR